MLLPALTALRRLFWVHVHECKEMECAVATSIPTSERGHSLAQARLAQSAERKAFNLVVVGSSPTVGVGVTSHVCLRLASRHAMFHVLARDVRCASWRVVKYHHCTVSMVVCSVKAETLLNFELSLGRHST